MKRKRKVKLLMAMGMQRNDAVALIDDLGLRFVKPNKAYGLEIYRINRERQLLFEKYTGGKLS